MTARADHTAAEITDTGTYGSDEVRFTAVEASTLTLYAGDIGIETVVIGIGTAASAVTTGTTALNVNAALVTNGLIITGNAGDNSLTGTGFSDTLSGGEGNDSLFGGLGTNTLTGGKGHDTFTVTGTDTITDLGAGGADVLKVSAGAIANAIINTAWSATALTTNNGTANISTSGLAVDLRHVTTGTNGFSVTNKGVATTLTGSDLADTLIGGAGNDTLSGSDGNDSLNGGKGQDSLTGGEGSDTFLFAAGDNGITATTLDKISDYTKGAVSIGDLIDYSATLTIGGNAATATASKASINQATGIATFALGSGATLADAINDITASFTAATNTLGEFAFFKINNTGDYYLFVSDGTAGAGVNDDVIQLVGVTSISAINLTSGNLTITG